MSKKETRPERVIALIAGESGTGKSFFVANLKRALIFDTDVGGGLAYLSARIERNGSELVPVGNYPEVLAEVSKRRQNGTLKNYLSIAIDHLTTLQQEAVLRYNPSFAEDTFGREHDRANKEWRKVVDLVRLWDFNLVCTAHLKNKYEKKKVAGLVADAAKNAQADFNQYLHLHSRGPNVYPATATVIKWRRDPEDDRGAVPQSFPFTMENFLQIHAVSMEGERTEVPLATKEQVAKLMWLLNVVKPDKPDWADRALAKAKVDSWSEMTQDQIGACINYLEGIIEEKGEKVHREREPNGVPEEKEAAIPF